MSESGAHNKYEIETILYAWGLSQLVNGNKAGLTHSESFSSETSSRLSRRAAALMQALQVDVSPP